MRTNTRRLLLTLLPATAILLLLGLAWPEPAQAQVQQTFSVDFQNKAGVLAWREAIRRNPAG